MKILKHTEKILYLEAHGDIISIGLQTNFNISLIKNLININGIEIPYFSREMAKEDYEMLESSILEGPKQKRKVI